MRREYEFYATPLGRRSKGGTTVAYKRLNIRTIIQVVALEVYFIGRGRRTVCSIYLLPTD